MLVNNNLRFASCSIVVFSIPENGAARKLVTKDLASIEACHIYSLLQVWHCLLLFCHSRNNVWFFGENSRASRKKLCTLLLPLPQTKQVYVVGPIYQL